MKKAIFPGSFDPLTLGHLDIIERSAHIFDEVIVVLADNSEKHCFFTLEQRIEHIQQATKDLCNVRVDISQGLTVDYAHQQQVSCIIRGIRSIKDYEYELDIAAINRQIAPDIETVILFTDQRYSYVSSGMIREMIKYQQDIRPYVSEEVAKALESK